ncbi:MAG: radical SAM protein [Deltaproteobacteria bacterium]|nr:radical SAM protein [Deltaproteobacteria bacterium]
MPRGTEVVTSGLYVEPYTWCPLACRPCYTAHRERRSLPEASVFRAIEILLEGQEVLGVFWCGLGEVHEDPRFSSLLARCDARWGDRLLHVVQTNGQHPEAVPVERTGNKVFLVSIDLPRALHESFRGPGTWDPAVTYASRALAAGALGVGVKCLLTVDSAPEVGPAFEALRTEWGQAAGLGAEETARRVRLHPVVPFPREAVARVDRPSFRGGGWHESPAAVRKAALEADLVRFCSDPGVLDRPRTVEVSLTVDGVFSCCEAIVLIADLEDLDTLDRSELLARLRAAAPGCRACPLKDVCG